MKNTGKAYELFARDVFQAILKLKGIKNIEVKPSQDVAGTTLDEEGNPIGHEIDVHWEFELDGKIYKTLIQAKDWVNRVKKGQMIEFDGIIQDIPQSSGIFVAKSGFQSGAISWAKAKGIEAAELREPTPEELQNRIQHIRITFNIEEWILIGFSDLVVDPVWQASLTPEELQSLGPKGVHPPAIMVETDDGKPISGLVHFAIDPTECSGRDGTVTYTKACNPPVFLVGFGESTNRIKINQFTATVRIEKTSYTLAIDALLTHILRSVTGKENYFIAEVDGELRAFPVQDLPELLMKRAHK